MACHGENPASTHSEYKGSQREECVYKPVCGVHVYIPLCDMNMWISACRYMDVCVHIHVYVCVCICVYTYMYAQLHVPDALPRLEARDFACRGSYPCRDLGDGKADRLRHGGAPSVGVDRDRRRLNCGVHGADLCSPETARQRLPHGWL